VKHSVSIQFMWADLPFPDRARCAAEHGFDRVDLWDWRGFDIDELAETCKDVGIEIAGFFGNREGSLIDPSQRKLAVGRTAAALEVAKRVGAGQLHMFTDEIGPGGVVRKPPPLTWEAKWRSCQDGVEACLEVVDGEPVTLVLEAINDVYVPGYFFNDVGQVLAMCRAIDHPQVRMSFDCFHQQLSGGRLIDNLREALPYCARVDIADVPGRGQPGSGEINFHSIRRVLDEEGFDGQITYEVVPVDGDSERAVADIKRVFDI